MLVFKYLFLRIYLHYLHFNCSQKKFWGNLDTISITLVTVNIFLKIRALYTNVDNNIRTFEKLALICKPIGLHKIENIVGFRGCWWHEERLQKALLTRTRNLLNASDYDHIGIYFSLKLLIRGKIPFFQITVVLLFYFTKYNIL